MADEIKKEKRVLTSLAELGTRRFDVELELTDGEILVIPMHTLSFRQWNEAAMEVKDPPPPVMGADNNGAPIFDTKNPDYQLALTEASNKRSWHRLLASMDIEVPGESTEDKIEWMEDHLERGVAEQLVTVMMNIALEVKAHIADRAFSFHGAGSNGNENMPPDEVVDDAVEGNE